MHSQLGTGKLLNFSTGKIVFHTLRSHVSFPIKEYVVGRRGGIPFLCTCKKKDFILEDIQEVSLTWQPKSKSGVVRQEITVDGDLSWQGKAKRKREYWSTAINKYLLREKDGKEPLKSMLILSKGRRVKIKKS